MPAQPDQLIAHGLEFIQSGRSDEGVSCLTEAAEILLRLAEEADATQAGMYIQQTTDLMDVIERCRRGAPMPPVDSPLTLVLNTGVNFDDVIGMEEAKQILYRSMIRPILDPDSAQRWGRQPGGALLLYGPPGNGKTMFARAVGGELGIPFFEMRSSTVLSKWLSESERNVAKAFECLRDHDPCVLFIDEIDGLLGAHEEQSAAASRVVSEFLAAMDGMAGRQSGVFIMAATNYPERLSPALRRSLRFGRPVYIGLPDRKARLKMLEANLTKLPLTHNLDLEAWAGRLDRYSGADIAALAAEAAHHAWDREEETGTSALLGPQDLEYAASVIKPTCSEEDLKRYDHFGRLFDA